VITDENPETWNTIWKALPIRGNTNRWGDEIYFPVPVELGSGILNLMNFAEPREHQH